MPVVERTYASALFEAARERGSVERVREDLAGFVASVESVPELREMLRNPRLDPRARAAALDAILGETDELVRNFLLLLTERGRAGRVDDIQREFERLVAAEAGQLDVELTTAYELSDEEARAIVDEIRRVSGRPVTATRKTDPTLLGGIVLQVGSLRLDASVRNRLERLRHELATAR